MYICVLQLCDRLKLVTYILPVLLSKGKPAFPLLGRTGDLTRKDSEAPPRDFWPWKMSVCFYGLFTGLPEPPSKGRLLAYREYYISSLGASLKPQS